MVEGRCSQAAPFTVEVWSEEGGVEGLELGGIHPLPVEALLSCARSQVGMQSFGFRMCHPTGLQAKQNEASQHHVMASFASPALAFLAADKVPKSRISNQPWPQGPNSKDGGESLDVACTNGLSRELREAPLHGMQVGLSVPIVSGIQVPRLQLFWIGAQKLDAPWRYRLISRQ